jgi:hypothetical protein
MPRSFEIVTESEASVEQIFAAFGREDYWLARLASDASTRLDSLSVDRDNQVEVRITQHLTRQVLPALAARFVPGDLKLQFRETWRPAEDGKVRGETRVFASGGLGSSRAENWLTPVGDASRLRSVVELAVKIPVVGGKLEESIGASLAENVPVVLRFTTEWLAGNV